MYDPLRTKAKLVLYSALAFLMGVGLASGLGWTESSLALPVVVVEPQVSEAIVGPARELSAAFVEIADVVTPGVVRIEVRRTGRTQEEVPEAFRRFFDEDDAPQGPPVQLGGGSGFIISGDGYILTNDHVVSGSDQIRVYLTDRRYFDAELVGTDPFTDVAVIKIEADEELPMLSLGSSDDVRVGEWILAIGNPGFGAGTSLDYTVTAGIVSARGRGLQLINNELGNDPNTREFANYAIEDFIQTDAVINPGNSGGPMVDLRGRVVGINSAIASRTGFYQGYGFAVPINLARRVMEDLVEYGHVRRPMIGVTITNVSPEDAEKYNLPSVTGALVTQVAAGNPAAVAGLQPQDVIVAVEGKAVGYSSQLQERVAAFRPGERVTVTIYRDGGPRDFDIRLAEAPIGNIGPTRVVTGTPRREDPGLGISVEELDAATARELNYPEAGGVLISDVRVASAAWRRNVRPGLKLVAIDDHPVSTLAEALELLGSLRAGDVVTLHLEDRTGARNFTNIRVPPS
jgi:serine protease Do